MEQQCRHIPYRGKLGVEEAAAGTGAKLWRKMSAADDEPAGRMRKRKEGHSPYLPLLRSSSSDGVVARRPAQMRLNSFAQRPK